MRKQRVKVSPAVIDSARPILLDTHIAIWLADNNQRLGRSTVSLLEEGFNKNKLCMSIISAWEIGLLVSKKRLDLGQPPLAWLDIFVRRFKISLLEISPEIAINSSYLPGKIHGDPADRIIIATAMTYAADIVSADKNILSYAKHGFVRIITC
jgi:PIN domain nuclease of toxin-antitoxin system